MEKECGAVVDVSTEGDGQRFTGGRFSDGEIPVADSQLFLVAPSSLADFGI